MKRIMLACCVCCLMTGCVSTSKIVEALGNDPATAYISITTIHGTVKIVRSNNGTNSVSVTEDGSISVNK